MPSGLMRVRRRKRAAPPAGAVPASIRSDSVVSGRENMLIGGS
jgi:hypothetical protein